MQRQLELQIVCWEWEEIVAEGGREDLRSALREMLRAYFREVRGEERGATDGRREDSSQS
jgi:hypothetical protein